MLPKSDETYEHDLFISYAHVDDLSTSETGWVTLFGKELEIALIKRMGRMNAVKIWRDRQKLDGSTLFGNSIKAGLGTAALFIALTSKGYLVSEYCLQELADFKQKASNDAIGLTVGNRLRIVNVLLNNIDHTEWPEEFSGTTGFPFYDAERDDLLGNPSEPGSALFKKQLTRLVDALHAQLTEMKEITQPPPDPSARTVYLADVPDTLRSRKRRIIKDLKEHNIDVITNIPPPYDAAAHDREVIDVLERVDLSVHLMDAFGGRELDWDEDRTYPQQQVDLAIKHAPSQMIWVPQKLEIAVIDDEGHRAFMQALEEGKGGDQALEFIRATPDSITPNILQILDQISGPEADALPSSTLLVTQTKDQLCAFKVAEALQEAGIMPFINQEASEPRAVLRLFEERLKQVASLIIFFGAVSRDWVWQRIEAAVKIAVLEEQELKLGVYLVDKPRTEVNFSRGFFQVHILGDVGDALSFLQS